MLIHAPAVTGLAEPRELPRGGALLKLIVDSVHVLLLTALATTPALAPLFAKIRSVAFVTVPFNPCTVNRR